MRSISGAKAILFVLFIALMAMANTEAMVRVAPVIPSKYAATSAQQNRRRSEYAARRNNVGKPQQPTSSLVGSTKFVGTAVLIGYITHL